MRMSPGRSRSRKNRRLSNSIRTRIELPPTRKRWPSRGSLRPNSRKTRPSETASVAFPRRSSTVSRDQAFGRITVPKAYGGAGVSFATLAEVIAIISAADPSLRQLPQNHLAALDAIRVTASEEQKLLWLHDPVRWKYFHVGNHLLNGVAPPRHAWS